MGTYDGPGLRFVVFLQGCNFRCLYCANPDTIDAEGESKLTSEYDILKQATDMKPFFGKRGGVTFSGGEPLAQSEFLFECLSLLRGRLHTALQTCGYCSNEVFKRALGLADYFLFDLKLIDSLEHLHYTGVRNEPILQNFDALSYSGVEFTVRMPLIPTVSDTEHNITAAAELLRSKNIDYIELLPYNRMAGGKYEMLLRRYEPNFDESLSCLARTEIFERYGIKAKIL